MASKDSGVVLNAESGEFSTYAIAYDDSSKNPVVPKDPVVPRDSVVKTGDSVPRVLIIAIALLAITSIGIICFAFKRSTDV